MGYYIMKYYRVLEADKALLEAQEEVIREFGIQTMASVFGHSIAYDSEGEILGVISKRRGRDNEKILATRYANIVTEGDYCYLIHPSDSSLGYSEEYTDYIEENLTNNELEVVEVNLNG